MNRYFQDLLGREYFGMKLGLSKVSEVLKELGHPEQRFPSIHIAGTNGKGSTAAMIASILQGAGYKVGLYTSPHLVDLRERFQINGEMISEKECEALMEELQALGASLSFFEFMTLLSFLYFARKKVGIAVIETGLGGRLDATNVITPLVSVITTIGLDHTEHLGDTLEKIAFEKAGIIKPGLPVVCGEMAEETLGVIRGQAGRVGANLVFAQGDHKDRPYKISLPGHHQQKNAACAVTAIEILRQKGWRVSEEAITLGLKNVRWPGRLEMISKEPPVLLDGAHNPQAMVSLRLFLEEEYRGVPIRLVLGLMADKDIRGILDEIVPVVQQVVTTKADSPRAMDPSVLAEMVRGYGKEVVVTKNVEEAIRFVVAGLKPAPTLNVITGSLFVVGEARRAFVNRAASQTD